MWEEEIRTYCTPKVPNNFLYHNMIFLKKKILTNVLKGLVKKLFLKTFYWKNNKIINIIDVFLYFL